MQVRLREQQSFTHRACCVTFVACHRAHRPAGRAMRRSSIFVVLWCGLACAWAAQEQGGGASATSAQLAGKPSQVDKAATAEGQSYLDAWVDAPAADGASNQTASPSRPAAAPVTQDKCRAIQQMQVCSHRANASELPEVAALGPHAALVQRMHALEEQAGIICFDLDVSVTKKGRLVVGHPNDIKAHLLKLKLQAAGSGNGSAADSGTSSPHMPASATKAMSGMFPLLNDALQAFGAMTDAHKHAHSGGNATSSAPRGEEDDAEAKPATSSKAGAAGSGAASGGGGVPLLLLELKSGSSTNTSLVREVADTAGQLGIASSVAIWVVHPTMLKLVQKVLAPKGQEAKGTQSLRLIKAVRNLPPAHQARHAVNQSSAGGDTAAAQPPLTAEQLAPYDLVGPSVRFDVKSSEAPYAAVKAARKPMALWTVDTEEDLDKALALEAEFIITNRPIHMQELLRQRGAACGSGA